MFRGNYLILIIIMVENLYVFEIFNDSDFVFSGKIVATK